MGEKPEIAQTIDEVKVLYECKCGKIKPISKLYFCRHCLQIRCAACLSHEIDSFYCPMCLENMPSPEAKLRKNKCATCLTCPVCQHTLQTKAQTVQNSQGVQTKAFYSACLTCRWTTRDVGISDLSNASGSINERENPNERRIQDIQDYYKTLIQRNKHEKILKKKQQKQQKKLYVSLTDKAGMSASALRKRFGISEQTSSGNLNTKPSLKEIKAAEANEELSNDDVLPESIFTKPLQLNMITSIEQRLKDVVHQPRQIDRLYPQRVELMVKRSQRCRQCEHNVLKPEYNPNSIKFKIHQMAAYHIPNIKFVTIEPFRVGGDDDENNVVEMLLKFQNPTQYDTHVELMRLVDDETENIDQQQLSSSREASGGLKPNCEIIMDDDNEINFVLSKRDDAAEFDLNTYTSSASNQDQSKSYIISRKLNSVILKLRMRKLDDGGDAVKINDKIVLAMRLCHTYFSTIASLDNIKQPPQEIKHAVRVYIQPARFLGNNK